MTDSIERDHNVRFRSSTELVMLPQALDAWVLVGNGEIVGPVPLVAVIYVRETIEYDGHAVRSAYTCPDGTSRRTSYFSSDAPEAAEQLRGMASEFLTLRYLVLPPNLGVWEDGCNVFEQADVFLSSGDALLAADERRRGEAST